MYFLKDKNVIKAEIPFESEYSILSLINKNLLKLDIEKSLEQKLIERLKENGIETANVNRYGYERLVRWLLDQKESLLIKYYEYKIATLQATIKRLTICPVLNKPEVDYCYRILELFKGMVLLLKGASALETRDILLSQRTYAKVDETGQPDYLFDVETFKGITTEGNLYEKLAQLIFEVEIDKNTAPVKKSKKSITTMQIIQPSKFHL